MVAPIARRDIQVVDVAVDCQRQHRELGRHVIAAAEARSVAACAQNVPAWRHVHERERPIVLKTAAVVATQRPAVASRRAFRYQVHVARRRRRSVGVRHPSGNAGRAHEQHVEIDAGDFSRQADRHRARFVQGGHAGEIRRRVGFLCEIVPSVGGRRRATPPRREKAPGPAGPVGAANPRPAGTPGFRAIALM